MMMIKQRNRSDYQSGRCPQSPPSGERHSQMSRFTDRNLLGVLDLDGQDFLNPLLPALIESSN
jgi:hypothetical protein